MLYKDLDKSNPNFEYVTKYIVKLTNDEIFNKKKISKYKVNKINKRISPIKDKEIEEYFKNKKLDLKATTDYRKAFEEVEFVIISTPTNYDEETNYFDTTSVEDIIRKVISINKDATNYSRWIY